MRTLKSLASTLVVAVVLVASLDYAASAATGRAFLLGKLNKANRATSLARTTAGPALKLTTRSSASAPLVVNGQGKVANLNVDALDGLDASALRTTAHVFSDDITTATDSYAKTLPLPPGRYLLSYSVSLPGAADEHVQCFVRTVAGSETVNFTADSSVVAGDDTPALSASGLVTQSAGRTIVLQCNTDGPNKFTTSPNEPVQVVALQMDTVVPGGALVDSSIAQRLAR